MFGAGISWVYVSIHDFGFTGVPLAIVMTSLFVIFLSLVFSLPYFLYRKYAYSNAIPGALIFAALWVFGEWLRAWLFTGFPWLYLGYAHIDSPLSGYAPIGGVFLLSFVGAITAALIAKAIITIFSRTYRITLLMQQSAAIVVLWCGGALLGNIEWTKATGEQQSVAIIQPNVSLFKKWDPFSHPEILRELIDAARMHRDADIQIWPEAAIPTLYHNSERFLDAVNQGFSNTNIFTGILFDEESSYEVYNSIIGLGKAEGRYFKQKLVPFGEYVPFEDQLRGLIDFFNLPNSVIRRGPYLPNALQATRTDDSHYIIAPFICYEVVYPDFVASNAKDAELLFTISNDAWFGKSAGPHQHFEMVRMRALENQKDIIRSTNTGISAIVNHRGEITVSAEQFIKTSVTGKVELRQGQTPFNRFGSTPILSLCILLCALSALVRIRTAQREN